MKYGLTFIIFVFLSGCGQQTSQTTDSNKEDTLFHKVVFLDKYYTDFLTTVKSDFQNRDKIYAEKIKDAIIKDHFSNAEYPDFVSENFSHPIADTSGLTIFIADLKAHKNEIEKIISSAFNLCNKHLKNNNVTFYIIPLSSDDKEIINKMGGVTGLTIGSKQIFLTIDFTINSWQEVLEYAVAHEFNHSYHFSISSNALLEFTLLRNLISEGMADSFAHLLYPKVSVPWTSALSNKEKAELWSKIKPDLQSDDPTLLNSVMFGSKDYPIWGGYTLGYDIIQTVSKNRPDFFKTKLTISDDKQILELSDYK
ncbi:MAG: hypothetical protein J0L69_07730 [Bacteroidetes bacterium]|nr:hypothetical protein [Bacteroidota bacterium]